LKELDYINMIIKEVKSCIAHIVSNVY
jgi:hypothetical protein